MPDRSAMGRDRREPWTGRRKGTGEIQPQAELLKVGVQKGADIAIAHAPSALQHLQTLFAWFKS
jgi:hypothetical protein